MPEFKLLIGDDEVEHLKVLAAKQRVRPQVIAREAFRAGMAQRTTTNPVPLSDSDTRPQAASSIHPSQLRELRALLEKAVELLDGVLTDGQSVADQIGKIERAVATGQDLGGDSQDPASTRVTKPKARRGR